MNPPRKTIRGRVRIHPRIDATLARRLTALSAARKLTETALVEDALRQYMDGTRDATLILRQLERIFRELERSHRDVQLHGEAFAIWTKSWFAHTLPMPEDGKRAARLLGETRYKQFVAHVTEQFAAGKRFLDDLPREQLADEEELAELAGGDSGKEPT